MGKWFPGIRTGTPEQARAYREALRDLAAFLIATGARSGGTTRTRRSR